MTGSELRQLRQGVGLKARELAERLEVTPETISRYENGHHPIPKMVSLAVQFLCKPTITSNVVAPEVGMIQRIREIVGADNGA